MTSRALTTPEFSFLLQSSLDNLSLVVKAHHSIEARLQDILEHVLPRASALELRRVAFLLKVDFLIALGICHPKFRPLFEQTNSIRNRFAHNPYATWEPDDAVRVKSAIRAIDPSYPCEGYDGNALKLLLHVVFAYSTRKHNEQIEAAVRAEVLQELQSDPDFLERLVPGHSELPAISEDMLREVQELFESQLDQKVRARLAKPEALK